MKLRILSVTRASAAGLLASLVLAACGGGGGFDDPVTPATNERVLSSFESGTVGLAAATAGGSTSAGAATLTASTEHATAGAGSVRVTLNEADAMVSLAIDNPDWTGYRSLLVDVYSSTAIDATAPLLVTKSGAGFTWCTVAPAQAVAAGSKTTLSFRLDWSAMTCFGTGWDKANVREMYIKVGAAARAEYYIDNIRLTKAVRVLPLGDSITGNNGCWRKTLWNNLQSGSTAVDMVGVRDNEGDCGNGWDGGNAGFGGMRATNIGNQIGLASASRTDTVWVADGVTPKPGNLAVWLEQTRPEMVMLYLGTNDLWGGVSASAIIAGYDTLIAQMRASNPKMHILVAQTPLFTPSGCTDCPTRAAAFNTALASWAACARTAVSPISVVNLADGWDTATMTDDGVHPNAAGAARMATNWFAPVRDALDGIDTNGSGPADNCVSTDVSDIANATVSADGNTFTISSFRTGLGAFTALTNAAANATADQATVALDTANHATDGSHAAAMVVIAPPVGGWIGFANTSNGGLADWSGYRYLRFDVTTASDALNAVVVAQSGSVWCQSPTQTVAAGSTGTLVLDLNTCPTLDLANVQRHQLGILNASGTFYVDNVRLERGSSDIADATVSTDGNTFTISSFRDGLGSFKALTNAGVDAALGQATAAPDTAGHATEGSQAAAVVVIAPPADGWIGFANTSNGGLADWSGYRYLRFDVTTVNDALNASLAVQSGATWGNWCQSQAQTVAAGTTSTFVLDLSTCGANIDLTIVQRHQLVISSAGGTFYVDNVRLTTD